MLIIGERYNHLLKDSPHLSFESIRWMPDNPLLEPRLAGHVDLSILKAGAQDLIVSSGLDSSFVNSLTNGDYSVLVLDAAGNNYPEDAGLCICHTGKYTLYNPKTANRIARKRLNGILIAVTQGYTKCSVCRVLHIQHGFIELDGFDYGFIGGATFKLNDETLAFTGRIDHHPDSVRIMQFLETQGVRPVFLTPRKIFDIGSAITL